MKYTRGECKEAIRQVADEVGKSPTVSEYKKKRSDGHPSISHLIREFGSWVEAKKAAGLEKCFNSSKYTEEECIDAIQYVANKLDKSPAKSEYCEHRPNSAPSIDTIQRKFGSWSEAKITAGEEPLSVVGVSESDCIEALKTVAQTIGDSPTKSEYDEARPATAPSSQVIEDRLGSWNQAKREAGLDIDREYYDEEDCLEALRQAAENVEGALSKSKYRENRPETAPSLCPIEQKFESWNQAKAEAGLEIQYRDDTIDE